MRRLEIHNKYITNRHKNTHLLYKDIVKRKISNKRNEVCMMVNDFKISTKTEVITFELF